jgi:hypothetical protein
MLWAARLFLCKPPGGSPEVNKPDAKGFDRTVTRVEDHSMYTKKPQRFMEYDVHIAHEAGNSH